VTQRVHRSLPLAVACTLIVFSFLAGRTGASSGSTGTAIPVEVAKVAGGYQLLRGGEPYVIKGAGMEIAHLPTFAAHGGNSLRTWSTGNEGISGQKLLDEAARQGLTVALCLDLARERHGFDYDDKEAVARQLEYARAEVLKYKDHPALLFWIIGNELNHSASNPAIFDAINDISRMIHEVDGKHPTTTALAGFSAELVAMLEQRTPDLDFPSFQLYAAIDALPEMVSEAGFTAPFMVTEWGATGHWEVQKTRWGAPIEASSSEKAQQLLRRYERVIAANSDQIIGSYVFLWGQKQERTPTWYGLLLEDGGRTEATDAMYYIWKGEWPAQRSPQVRTMLLDGKKAGQNVTLLAGMSYSAMLDAIDPNGGDLDYQWVVMRESAATEQGGDREEIPDTIPVKMEVGGDGRIVLSAPEEPGPYRLFARAYDSDGLAGYANIPFLVEPASR
jgi:hypothetical protein